MERTMKIKRSARKSTRKALPCVAVLVPNVS